MLPGDVVVTVLSTVSIHTRSGERVMHSIEECGMVLPLVSIHTRSGERVMHRAPNVVSRARKNT
jgi:hypothetical protein